MSHILWLNQLTYIYDSLKVNNKWKPTKATKFENSFPVSSITFRTYFKFKNVIRILRSFQAQFGVIWGHVRNLTLFNAPEKANFRVKQAADCSELNLEPFDRPIACLNLKY